MLDPAEVVIICGPWYWHSAATPAGLDHLPKQNGPLIAAGIVDGRAWIVGYHPRYASQGFRVGAYAYAELIARTVGDLRGDHVPESPGTAGESWTRLTAAE
jgi:hypothetical protein